jgi:hypothetical protein
MPQSRCGHFGKEKFFLAGIRTPDFLAPWPSYLTTLWIDNLVWYRCSVTERGSPVSLPLCPQKSNMNLLAIEPRSPQWEVGGANCLIHGRAVPYTIRSLSQPRRFQGTAVNTVADSWSCVLKKTLQPRTMFSTVTLRDSFTGRGKIFLPSATRLHCPWGHHEPCFKDVPVAIFPGVRQPDCELTTKLYPVQRVGMR